MSNQVDTALVNHFSANVDFLAQQKESLLAGHCRIESQNAETGYFDQIGKSSVVEITSRHAATPRVDTPHERRAVSLGNFVWADQVDSFDKVRMLSDPNSAYAKTAAMAMNRHRDKVFIDAALGNARAGKAGETTVALPASQQIAASGTGLTLEKILRASEILNANDIDPMAKRYFALSPKQVTEMLNIDKITSSDYVILKALTEGKVSNYMGFHFICSNLLNASGSDRQCIAWVEDGMLMANGSNPITEIERLPTINYSYQIFRQEFFGATRMEEEKVVQIDCQES